MKCATRISLIILSVSICSATTTANMAAAEDSVAKVSDGLWSRTHRVFAYDAQRQARHPSLGRNRNGDLVILFTHVTEEQEKAGVGDVMMIQSSDRGETWSAPTKVYEGTAGQPRTMGTLTKLDSGKLVAAMAEVGKGQPLVRLLTSADDGQTWTVGERLKFDGVGWAPYGRLFEGPQGTMLMPVHATVPGEQKETVGLLRSSDGGTSWGDFSVIAPGFSHPTVLPTGEKTLLAVISRGEQLYRCKSSDNGYQWTTPQQFHLGREPQLARVADGALACVFSRGYKWGWILAAYSYDNGETWRFDRKVMENPGNPGGHFGWPTALSLDADNLVVAFGHTQLPSASLDAPPTRPIAATEERIEVVFFERDQQAPPVPLATKITPSSARDGWEPSGQAQQLKIPTPFGRVGDGELIAVTGKCPGIWLSRAPNFKVVWGAGVADKLWHSVDRGHTWQDQPIELPRNLNGTPSLVTRLASGRLLCVITNWLLAEWNNQKKIIGKKGGYYIWDPNIEEVNFCRLFVIYSDDDGKSWKGTDTPIDVSPLQWANPNFQFIEQEDGTIVLPIFGSFAGQDDREALNACALVRSTNSGETWGDFSLIAHDKERRQAAYNEAVVVPVSDDRWVTFMRTEYRAVGNELGWTSRSISTDRGYTWSQPEVTALGGAFGIELLPDGGLVVGHGAALGHGGGLHFTYDLGRTWTRLAPADGYAVPMLMDKETLLVGNGQNWGKFQVWRRIPAKQRR